MVFSNGVVCATSVGCSGEQQNVRVSGNWNVGNRTDKLKGFRRVCSMRHGVPQAVCEKGV